MMKSASDQLWQVLQQQLFLSFVSFLMSRLVNKTKKKSEAASLDIISVQNPKYYITAHEVKLKRIWALFNDWKWFIDYQNICRSTNRSIDTQSETRPNPSFVFQK